MSRKVARLDRRMVRGLREKWGVVRAHLRGGASTPAQLGRSVALGFFVGTLPLYGLQTILSSALGWLFGLDVLVVALASNVSLPPFIPILLYLDLTVGTLIARGEFLTLSLSSVSFSEVGKLGLELIIGAAVVSAAFAAIGFGLGYFIGRRLTRGRARMSVSEPLQV